MNVRKVGHDFIDFVFKYSLHISSILIVLLSVIDISNLDSWKISKWGLTDFPIGKIIYYLTVIGTLIFGLFSINNSNDITKLEANNSEKSNKIIDLENALNDSVKEMNDLFNSYLMLLVKNLNFSHSERISVYKVFEERFILIGRSSNNPNLQRSGRSNYPRDEGFIGKGWAEGEYFINDLPDPAFRNGDTYYNQINSICKIDRGVIKKMNMLSRTYFVYRINGYDSQPKAILVIESLNPNGFEKDEVINKLMGVKQPLVMFIEKNNGVKLQLSNSLGL